MNDQRHFLFTLPYNYHPEESPLLGFDPVTYSRFKHGCRQSIASYATPLARMVENLSQGKRPVNITSSAYLTVPTAITILVDLILTDHLKPKHYNRIKLTRDRVISVDYATLSLEERKLAMENIHLDFKKKQIKDRTLIVIDDSYLSGSHESLISRHLEGICTNIIYVYLVDMRQCHMSDIEMSMNNFEVKRLFDLVEIMNQPGFVINSRVLKMIFSASLSEFAGFTSLLDHMQQDQIYRHALSEKYARMGPLFVEKLEYLHAQTATSRKLA